MPGKVLNMPGKDLNMPGKDLKIVFFGTPEFAVESLGAIVDAGYNVAAVVTMPDKPAGRGHHLFESPVKRYAVEHNIPVLQPVKLKDPQFLDELRSIGADLFIVIAFRMLPEAVWQMPPLGTFNLHASLLPRYRGAAPINWAVINGDTCTGVTTFFLKHEIDTGDVIAQEKVDILPTDNAGDVHDRLMLLGRDLVLDTIRRIIDGNLRTVPQEQLLTAGEEPTPAPKIFKDTCRIDWNRPALQVHNLVRGLSPYPCAWTELYPSPASQTSDQELHSADSDAGGKADAAPLLNMKVIATRVIDGIPCAAPGAVSTDGRLAIQCGDGKAVEILRLQPSGKKAMDAADYLRGARLPESLLAR